MRELRLEPSRLASFLSQTHPDEAYEIALDFLNDSVNSHNREGAMTWTAVLAMIEKLLSEGEYEPDLLREPRAGSLM